MATPVTRIDVMLLARRAWERRVTLLRFHAAVGTLAVAVVLLLPRWYSSSVTLVPAPRDGLSLDLSGLGNGALGGTSLSLGAGPTPQDQLKMVASSRAVADSLVSRFDLVRRWHLRRREQARERLADHVTITTPREGQVVVAVEARTPVLARDMAAAFAVFAGREAVRLKTSLASQRRIYLEARLDELDREIGIASARVRGFEEKHGAYSLPDQARETVDAAGQLAAQVALLETERSAARRYFTDESPEVHMLSDRIVELERQIGLLARRGGTFSPQATALPALKQEYLKLTRDQAGLMAVSELLRRFTEQARVEESNPVPTFSVLDAADLPERHARPKRGLTVALALAAAAALSIVWLQRADAPPAPALARPAATVPAAGSAEREAA
jgi:uncharacterized protein involved in exopolysaccharide biosynthesis